MDSLANYASDGDNSNNSEDPKVGTMCTDDYRDIDDRVLLMAHFHFGNHDAREMF